MQLAMAAICPVAVSPSSLPLFAHTAVHFYLLAVTTQVFLAFDTEHSGLIPLSFGRCGLNTAVASNKIQRWLPR
jgi:hypothetical protein